MRHLRGLVATSNGTWREAEYQGRPHVVVPVVALVEGVLQAMNAATPELVREAEFSRAPQGWNGRPVFLGHPMLRGQPVSGNTPKLLEQKSIGTIFNAGLKPKKLVMEAWIDVEKSDAVEPRTLERVRANEPIEISVGTFVETDDSTGEYDGTAYEGEWHDIVPDHLALLPEDETGACSRKMGCGVRAAKGSPMDAEKSKAKKNLFTKMLQALRIAQAPEEMSSNDLNRELVAEIRKFEPAFMFIEAWMPVETPDRVVYTCYEGSSYCTYERAFTMDANGKVTLNGDRIEVEPVLTYEPVALEAPEALAGKAISKNNAEKIQAMHDHSVALGATCAPKAAASCGCTGKAATQGEPVMERKERVKALISSKKTLFTEADSAMLEACSDEAMARFEAAASAEPKTPEAPAAAAAPAVAAPVATPAAAAAPAVEEPKAAKAATMDEVLQTASPEVRDMFNEGLRVGKQRKDASIKALKDSGRCSYTDAQLNAMSQIELDQLTALAQVQPKAAVDYSGNGIPKSTSEQTGVPAAPDFNAAVKAARAKK